MYAFRCAKCGQKGKPILGRRKYKVTGETVDGRKKYNHQCVDCVTKEQEYECQQANLPKICKTCSSRLTDAKDYPCSVCEII